MRCILEFMVDKKHQDESSPGTITRAANDLQVNIRISYLWEVEINSVRAAREREDRKQTWPTAVIWVPNGSTYSRSSWRITKLLFAYPSMMLLRGLNFASL